MKTAHASRRVSSLLEIPDALLEELAERLQEDNRRVVEARVEMPSVDPLAWLAAQPKGCRIYWSSRDESFVSAAVAMCDHVHIDRPFSYSQLLDRLDPRYRYYGGLRFDPSIRVTDEAWAGPGYACFVLPRVELTCVEGGCSVTLRFNRDDDDTSESAIRQYITDLTWEPTRSFAAISTITNVEEYPDRHEWHSRVARALRCIDAGGLQKVVLARRQTLSLDQRADPVAVLAALRSQAPDCFHFLFELGSRAFVVASPELLYRRQRSRIKSEAMAGTRRRGATPDEDRLLGDQLLGSDKDRREHRYVADHIVRALRELCRQSRGDGCMRTELRRLRLVQHLIARFEGNLRPDVTDADILEALHPTPAVCGLPRTEALKFIAETEERDRGWYAGPIGWFDGDGAELAVGIRSMLLGSGPEATLFAGCGLVEGSTAAGEWEETAAKLAGLRAVFEDHE
jgi:menaquinone-specific isochorismate synthase